MTHQTAVLIALFILVITTGHVVRRIEHFGRWSACNRKHAIAPAPAPVPSVQPPAPVPSVQPPAPAPSVQPPAPVPSVQPPAPVPSSQDTVSVITDIKTILIVCRDCNKYPWLKDNLASYDLNYTGPGQSVASDIAKISFGRMRMLKENNKTYGFMNINQDNKCAKLTPAACEFFTLEATAMKWATQQGINTSGYKLVTLIPDVVGCNGGQGKKNGSMYIQHTLGSFIHEFFHTLGLLHSNSYLNGNSLSYGDQTCVMGVLEPIWLNAPQGSFLGIYDAIDTLRFGTNVTRDYVIPDRKKTPKNHIKIISADARKFWVSYYSDKAPKIDITSRWSRLTKETGIVCVHMTDNYMSDSFLIGVINVGGSYTNTNPNFKVQFKTKQNSDASITLQVS
jgi:hypothetical protein